MDVFGERNWMIMQKSEGKSKEVEYNKGKI